MLWHSLERVMSESSQPFIEVPSREFQLFFKNYPEITYPKEEYIYGVNLGRCECYSHRNSKNEIVGIFEHWNNFELHSRYFIRADLKEYVNDKENFGKYDSNNQWQFDLQWQYWGCPHCNYRYYAEPLIAPPDECPKCHVKSEWSYNSRTNSEIENYIKNQILNRLYEKIETILKEPINEEALEKKAREMVDKARRAGEEAIVRDMAQHMANNVLSVYSRDERIVQEVLAQMRLQQEQDRFY